MAELKVNMLFHSIRTIAFTAIMLLSIRVSTAQSFFFSNLSTRDGLPSNIISAIAQDKDHFIWIGTANGISRYDGYTFKNFRREEIQSSLPANEISCLLIDGEFLWVGTWRGLCKINTRTFEITRIDLKSNNVIRVLFKDKSGNTWIGTASGLIRYDQNQQQVMYTTENSKLSHNTIRSLFEDSRGDLWVGTYDKLNRYDKRRNEFTVFDLKGAYKPELKNNLICDIKPVKGDELSLWIGTETGLCLFNTSTGQFTQYTRANSGFSNEVIKNIYTGPDGLVWLGTDFGLNRFDPTSRITTVYFNNPQLTYSIANNVIWEIFEDDGGVIWFVTSNGLSKINKTNHLFTYHEITHRIGDQTIGNQVKSLLVSTKGMLWFATIHGVIRIDPVANTQQVFDIESGPSERILLNNVFTLEEDDRGRIWIGTAGGINVWDEQTKVMHSISANANNGLTSNYIARFIKGADGSFWVSAWEGGLFKIVSGFETLESLKFEFVGNFASERIAYAFNAVWAMQNNELYRIDLDTYVSRKVAMFNAISNGKDIHNLYHAEKGSLWAGTLNGMIEYKPNLDSAFFHSIVTGNDIDFNNFVSDSFGNIWAAADKFILKYNPESKKTQLFPLDKDLPLRTFYSNCNSRDHDQILFGGDNGYLSFSTEIKPNTYNPNVFITGLEIDNKAVEPLQQLNSETTLAEDVAFTPEIQLDYSQRSITFSFASLHYWQPDINVFACKLEGLDEDWKYVSGTENSAVYSNLMPGTYTFKVKGTNNYGIWSDHEASMTVVINPPVLLSPMFIAAYVLLAIAGIIVAFRIYAIRLKLQNQLKIATLEKEHAEEIVKTKQDFFTSISHELRTPISLIIPPIQQVLKRNNLDEENRSLISIAEKNSQRLLRLINQILDFRKLEHENQALKLIWFDLVPFCQELYSLFSDKAARNEIDFNFIPKVNTCNIWADKEKVEIIIFNLLSNAFKFTPKNGKIALSIEIDHKVGEAHGSAKISVIDSGVGIAQEEHVRIFEQFYQSRQTNKIEDGSGIGLTLVSEYTKLHHGHVKLTSAKGKGSTFVISLPLGSEHFPVDKNDKKNVVDVLATRSVDETSEQYEFNLRKDKPLILLVEDNADMIQFIQVSLSTKYNIITADNGEEGLQKAYHFLPEIMISDIMMPVMNGLELCMKIKQDNRTSHIPIILLTAKSLTSHKIEGIKVGADIYLTKPFEIELLEAHIDHLLERKTELAQYFKNELITQPSTGTGGENEDDRFLKKVMNTIEANIANTDFSVESLSDEMGMSSTHLYRKLKSLTHLSANEIIKRYRIKKASLLLQNKEGNISEIMYAVGFSNLSYFSKCFKMEFGISPKEFQQQQSKHSYNLSDDLETPTKSA
ncbi:MAG TPA: two-component regulator propeller domain-containing protein [Chryseolinea sp.]|nr:two-component regulator propeller domain-containing protein [Chryseolinea sp.]